MSVAETMSRSGLVIKEVRDLAQARNPQETAARLKALDDRMSHILQRNTSLTREVERLKEVESRAKAIRISDRKQIELFKEENQRLQRELGSFRASAALKERLRSTKTCDLTEVKSIALRAQETAMRALKEELDATKRQLAEVRRLGLPPSPLRLPAAGSTLRAPPSSPIDVPLPYFSRSPAIGRPLVLNVGQ